MYCCVLGDLAVLLRYWWEWPARKRSRAPCKKEGGKETKTEREGQGKTKREARADTESAGIEVVGS